MALEVKASKGSMCDHVQNLTNPRVNAVKISKLQDNNGQMTFKLKFIVIRMHCR